MWLPARLEEGPAPSGAEAGGQDVRGHPQPDDETALPDAPAGVRVEHGAAGDGDDGRSARGDGRRQHRALLRPEGGLTRVAKMAGMVMPVRARTSSSLS